MEVCIFDLDGTLVDTLESITFSVNATLGEMGIGGVTREQCRSFVGDGARCLMERALLAAGEKDASKIEEAMRRYGRIFDENCTYHVTPYKGITKLLSMLKEKGIKLAVLSNKPHLQSVKVVESILGKNVFDCVQGQQEGVEKKPDPQGIFMILDELGMKREECLYIGDSEVDIATGRNAGILSVGVTWGFRGRQILEDAGARRVIDLPLELLNCI